MQLVEVKSTDPEITRRCHDIHEGILDDMMKQYPYLPMIDALWYDMNTRLYDTSRTEDTKRWYEQCVPYLRENDGLYPYDAYYDATWSWARHMLETGREDALQILLKDMWRRDLDFYASRGMSCPEKRLPK